MSVNKETFKKTVFEQCVHIVEGKIEKLQKQSLQIQESLVGETKSSVGDKYETARAMLHLDKEKIALQLSELSKQLQSVLVLQDKRRTNTIEASSLFKVSSQWYLLATSLGKVQVAGVTVFVVSTASPFGREIVGKSEGDTFVFGKIDGVIEELL